MFTSNFTSGGFLKPAAAVQTSIHAWEHVLFPPAVTPPYFPHHPLPAIYRANLKLHYYNSCTWCVGGRFRTSTPSINPQMGPTSWLNRPVPLLDDLSSARPSCVHETPPFDYIFKLNLSVCLRFLSVSTPKKAKIFTIVWVSLD